MAPKLTQKLLDGLTFSNVCSLLALTIALGTGTAYAANTVGSDDIIDGSVQSIDIKNGDVSSNDLKNGNVKVTDLGADAVDSSKVLDGSLTGADLGADSVDGANVVDDSLTVSDLRGVDVSTSISFSINAGVCGSFSMTVTGAQVGQSVLLSFGVTAPPSSVIFGPGRVSSVDHATFPVCNNGASTVSVTNLGVRVLTFA